LIVIKLSVVVRDITEDLLEQYLRRRFVMFFEAFYRGFLILEFERISLHKIDLVSILASSKCNTTIEPVSSFPMMEHP